jgi:murein DD-endopeptidase MepM/ murein hydrolase activator NlpD
MRTRHWTIVIVGDDTASPRTFHVSSRALRRARSVGGTACGAIVVALLFAGHRAPRAIAVAPVSALRDSVVSLQRQATALRVVAGLTDSVATAPMMPGSVDTLLHRADQLSVNLEQVAEKLHSDADRVARTPSIMPTAGWLTSQFSLSRFHPILHKYLPHLGIDVAAPYGTTVVAPAAGTVIRAGVASGYGFVMEIDHGNGIVTKYGHLSRFLVREHQQVVRGEPIAEVGNSGLATGPHLHYEVHVGGTIVDPLTYVLPSTIPEPLRQTAAPED